MLPDLTNKRFMIVGMQGSGKSVLARSILKQSPASFVYDVLKEYSGFNRYIVKHRQYGPDAVDELNNFVASIVIASGKVRMFVLEEANRYCPPKPHPLPDTILELNDFQRHMDIAFGCICRRPVQIHTDIIELAHYIFCFHLAGKNDVAYLNDLAAGLGDQVAALPEFHFVIVGPNHTYSVHDPVVIEQGG